MGRLLAVWQRDKMDNQGTTALFYTQDYDASNRISAQGWQFGDGTSFSGSYTYNTDGTLKDYDTDFYKAEYSNLPFSP